MRVRLARRGERGATLVETALVATLLVTLVIATFELGMAWRSSITLANAARAGARVASGLGVDAQADYSALLSVASAVRSTGSVHLDEVIVFDASDDSGAVPAACLALDPGSTFVGSSSSKCNVYSGAYVLALAAGGPSDPFTGTDATACASGAGVRPDRWWCPADRHNVQLGADGLDAVGVYVKVSHRTFTKLFGPSFTLDETSVMRIEPNTGSPA